MGYNKIVWDTEEIIEFMKRYYGCEITLFQRFELWLFGKLHRNKTYVMWDRLDRT